MSGNSRRARLVALFAVFALLLGMGVVALTTSHASSTRPAATREASRGEEGESAEEREHESR